MLLPIPATPQDRLLYCRFLHKTVFKYALAYLLRGARHALHDILLLRTSAIRRRLYLGRRLDSHQDEFVLLATYRGGSLISFQDKSYNFTITSSTTYDQKWSYGRTIYDTISCVVDEMFENFLSRPNVIQPILTQYCNGTTVTCPNWLSQWGSKYLGDQGYSAIQILRNYYGSSIYIDTAEEISGIPSSWPGYDLSVGSSGSKVRQMQQQLNRIHQNYPAIPTVTANGIFGPSTIGIKVFV